MDVGSELRNARLQRQLSIEELSRRTKITVPILRAIDSNDAAHLPGGVFTRAFVKQYAREVGLEPADVVHRYTAQFEPEPVVAAVGPERAEPDAETLIDDRGAPAAPLRFDDARVLAIAAALVLVAVSYVAFSRAHTSMSLSSERRAGSTVATDRPSSNRGVEIPQATGTSGAVAASRVTTGVAPRAIRFADTGTLRLDLQPRGDCWVTATADGRRVAFRLMRAGERQTIEARRELLLRVGDPGSFGFVLNGAPGRSLGPRGQPTTVRVTRANINQFVAR